MSADGEQDTPQPLARPEARDLAAMDGLDLLLLLALLPLHWTLFFLVVAQWFVRRNPRLLAGLLSYVGADHLQHHPAAAELLPGLRQLPPPSAGSSDPTPPPPPSDQVLHTLLAAAPPPAAATAPPTTAPLPFTHWRKLVHTAHNVIVVGAPQSGKSTLTRAFLPALAHSGQICLIDPHDQANDWPWPALGSGRDYPAIAQALAHLTDEMTRRYRRPGPHPPLAVIIDEVPSITLHRKREWETHYPQLVFEGAKVRLKTWILTQSAQVKPLGLEGKGDLRDSLLFLYLGPFAIEQCPASASQPYPAAIEHRGRIQPIDTTPLPVYAQLPVPEEARWHAPLEHADSTDAATDWSYVPGETSFTGARMLIGATGSETGFETGFDDLPHDHAISEEAILIEMMRRGLSQNTLCQFIGGNKITAIEQVKDLARRHKFEKYL